MIQNICSGKPFDLINKEKENVKKSISLFIFKHCDVVVLRNRTYLFLTLYVEKFLFHFLLFKAYRFQVAGYRDEKEYKHLKNLKNEEKVLRLLSLCRERDLLLRVIILARLLMVSI